MLGDIDGPEKAYRIMDSYFTVKMLQHVLQTDGQGERIEPRLGGATGDMSNSIFMRVCVWQAETDGDQEDKRKKVIWPWTSGGFRPMRFSRRNKCRI